MENVAFGALVLRLVKVRSVLPGFFLGVLLCGTSVGASGITYQGRIIRPDGLPVQAQNVTVTVQISSAGAEGCLLFQETHALDMRGSNGVFSITIGTGSRVSPSIDGGFPLARIFANDGAPLSPLPTCLAGSSYAAGADDTRRLTISFNDGSGVQTLQTQSIGSVPYAIESKQVSGYGIDSLLRVDGASAPAFNATEFGELRNLVSGSSPQYAKADELAGAALPALASGESLRWNGSGWEAVTTGSVVNAITAGTGLDVGAGPGGTITSTGTLKLSDTGVTAGTYGDAASIPKIQVDAQGRLASVTNVPLTTVANFSGALAGDVSGTQASTQVDRLKGVPVSATTPLAGQVLRHDGGQWAPAVPSVMDLKNASGTLQFPTTCTPQQTMIYSSVSDAYECQNIMLIDTTSTMAGDVSGSVLSNTVVKIQNRDVAANAPSAGQVLKWDGGAWTPSAELWSLSGSDVSYSAGNVGIGTAIPGAKLEIVGSSGTTLKIIDGNQGPGKVLTSDADGRASWQPANSGGGLNGMNLFTTTGTWTVPAGVTKVKVTAIGAGGGGAGHTMTCGGGCWYTWYNGSAGGASSLQGCSVQGGGGGGGVYGGTATEGTATGTIAIPGSGGIPSQVTPYAGSAGYGGGGAPGGGGGGTGIGVCSVTPGATLTVTVGIGGARSAGTTNPGVAGNAGWVLLEY